MVYLTACMVLVGIIAGALSHTAEESLPGDVLYFYKLQVNESFERLIAHSDVAQAAWNLRTLQERLAEARTLAKQDRLDTWAQTEVAGQVEAHVKDLIATIAVLQGDEAYESSAKLAADLYRTLEGESRILADVSSLGSTHLQIALAPVLTRLRTTTATVALVSAKAQAQAEHAENL